MPKSEQFASWVNTACQFPVGFAQVREDPLLDVQVIEHLNRKQTKVLMIASGGCTAALLATHPLVNELTVVDPNLSQLGLTQLKLHLLEHCSIEERLSILGHQKMPVQDRRAWVARHLNLLGFPADTLGDLDKVAESGLDYSGRYEYLFLQLQHEIRHFEPEIRAVLSNSKSTISENLKDSLNASFKKVMTLDNLIALYGEGATQNPAMPFWEHFFLQTMSALTCPLAKNNPFLSQLLLGQFNQQPYEWLTKPKQTISKKLTFLNHTLSETLDMANDSFDFIHLSNALDWLNPQEAKSMLRSVANKLNPGGMLILRQLNSTLDIPALGSNQIEWHVQDGADYLYQDRSFFYKRLLVGKKL
jgi:S-adenosylmethionine-diacylglycerol 3-amino-3-carboxypropyl transferase